ncbi:sulfatase-like hydrolase/transferase [Acanthopleuribacter pedis]|uniref:Sulfatase-like hydrolase/transferase n=1 Tax=Acanthopleuribacter pedis TaxID=442870 RepID=A0A8J7QE85_9BACT|nr:sulfatase-like hydrolase/transferase [Acanthopleuribacter pedis]MBO1321405.1 sulfatase-like hydrolase/transferase [Acanthopleuribacter pedis]
MNSASNVRPNILLILTDEERYPPSYEDAVLQAFRADHLPGRQALCENALVFNNHTIGSSACVPSRATLFTAHYPSLHGATQTAGVTKNNFDREMFWLQPTMGNGFRAGGYRTFYHVKWDM